MAAAEVVVKHCVDTRVYVPSTPRQCARSIAAVVAMVCLGVGLTGCASIHLTDMWGSKPDPASGTDASPSDATPALVTGSTAPSGTLSYAGNDHSDWDLIRSTVSASLSAPSSAHIEWVNRTTGSSGTISALAPTGGPGGRECRGFTSTIVTVDGVRLYRAEICRSVMNTWEFSRIVAADAQ